MSKKALLIISCSKNKKKFDKPMPAIMVYDGPFFKMLRKLNLKKIEVDIMILSAKYGLIDISTPIKFYEQKMTKKISQKISKKINSKLIRIIKTRQYKEIFISMGKTYYSIFNLEKINTAKIVYAKGGIGKKLKQTREWLLNYEKS